MLTYKKPERRIFSKPLNWCSFHFLSPSDGNTLQLGLCSRRWYGMLIITCLCRIPGHPRGQMTQVNCHTACRQKWVVDLTFSWSFKRGQLPIDIKVARALQPNTVLKLSAKSLIQTVSSLSASTIKARLKCPRDFLHQAILGQVHLPGQEWLSHKNNSQIWSAFASTSCFWPFSPNYASLNFIIFYLPGWNYGTIRWNAPILTFM